MFGLWSLVKAALLCANALAILNEDRFLAKYELNQVAYHESSASIKAQLGGLLHAVRYLRMPLVAINIVAILLELFFG